MLIVYGVESSDNNLDDKVEDYCEIMDIIPPDIDNHHVSASNDVISEHSRDVEEVVKAIEAELDK